MEKLTQLVAATFIKCTGYTYSNLARLFMRLFVGVMFMQFGIRHLVSYENIVDTFPHVFGWTSQTCLILMIIIELLCSLFIMVGFLTRLSVIPPIISMLCAEYCIIHELGPQEFVWSLDSSDPGYLPIMFLGIFLFILLAGPGKISLDYFVSIFIISRNGKNEEEELEEV